jgi:hypothetical protein
VKVVSDASALINLARIRELGLLHRLYGDLLIPNAVWQEVVIDGTGQPGSEEIEGTTWIKVKQVENRALVHALRQDLDAGEAEAHCPSGGIGSRPVDNGRAVGERGRGPLRHPLYRTDRGSDCGETNR